ncbi:MAG: hypothetical protein ACM4D3_07040 [Candidatus Sericytochromatia bacterium]
MMAIVIDLDSDAAAWVAAYRRVVADIHRLEEVRDRIGELLRAAVGEAEEACVDGTVAVRHTHYDARQLSQKLLRERVPAEVLDSCYEVVPRRRFTVTPGELL